MHIDFDFHAGFTHRQFYSLFVILNENGVQTDPVREPPVGHFEIV
jgi:hypothetical protein